MSVEKEEELIGIIPKAEYQEELEKEVRFHTARIMASKPFMVNKKYNHVVIPKFSDKETRDRDEWRLREIERCRFGYDGLPGRYYFYLNHTKIKHKSRGKIRPDFRTIDLEWFKFLDEIYKTPGKGVVSPKRRQVGMSWKIAANSIYNCEFNRDWDIGMNSKRELDSWALLAKVKYIYREQSNFLRIVTSTDRRDHLVFAEYEKDEFGNKVRLKAGTESSIFCTSPSPTAHAGNQYRELVIDEAGEQCFGEGTRVRMFDGSLKKIEEIEIGDVVMGVESQPLNVIARSSGDSQLYKISPKKGEPFVCNGAHLLTLKFNGRDEVLNIPVEEFIKLDTLKRRYYQLFKTGVDYPKQDYFFDPYWFGLWLGDGSKNVAKVVTMDKEILSYLTDECPELHDCDYSIYEHSHSAGLYSVSLKSKQVRLRVTEKDGRIEYFKNTNQLFDFYNITYRSYKSFLDKDFEKLPREDSGYHVLEKYVSKIENIYVNPTEELKKLGVLNDKHIPIVYLQTSKEDRLKLLAGLIDSDGHKDKRKNRYEITLSLKLLAEQVKELCLSLGLNASIKPRTVNYKYKDGLPRIHYRISITGNILHEIPCRLPRKRIHQTILKVKGRKDPQKCSFDITPVGVGTYYGIKLDKSPYFLLSDYTVVHNCDLLKMWSNAEDCISQDSIRVGTPIIFGTMGETGTFGAGLMEFTKKKELYDLERFNFWGYNGLILDEQGNDNIEESVRWIIYKRKKKEAGSPVVYNKFLQKYPLVENDYWLMVDGSGVGNPIVIGQQREKLIENPAWSQKGWMRVRPEGKIDFVPDNVNGKIILYEHPKDIVNGYVSGCDPADHDVDKSRDNSNLGLAILSKPFNTEPPKIVLEYVDRPKRLDEYFTNAALCLKFFNNTPTLIEDNRGVRMIKYFQDNGHESLLALTPRGINSVKGGVFTKYGSKMTAEIKVQMIGLLEHYLDNYIDFIPSERFLDECLVFGAEHKDDDFAVAVGWALIQLQSDKRIARTRDELLTQKPTIQYTKEGGRFGMTIQGKPVSPVNRPRSAIFKF